LSSRTSHYHRRETILVCSLYLRHVTIWMNEYQSSRRTPAATDIDDPVNRRQACRSLPEPVTSTYLSCPLGLTPSKPSRLDRAGLGSRCRQGAPSLQRPYSYPQRLDPCLLSTSAAQRQKQKSIVSSKTSSQLQSSIQSRLGLVHALATCQRATQAAWALFLLLRSLLPTGWGRSRRIYGSTTHRQPIGPIRYP
jgi:hypothetical protein